MSKNLFLRGCFNDWQVNSDYKFTGTEANNKLFLIVELLEGQYEFKIADSEWIEDYGFAVNELSLHEKELKVLTEKGRNIKLNLDGGVYKFIFDANSKSLEFHKESSYKQETFKKLKGINNLLNKTIGSGITAVEQIHKSVAVIPFEAMEKVEPIELTVKNIRNIHDTITGNVYNMIHSINYFIKEIGNDLIKIL